MFGRSSANPTINGRSLILDGFLEDPVRTRANVRLKLSGLLLRDSGVASPCMPPQGGRLPCAREHVARSRSAVR